MSAYVTLASLHVIAHCRLLLFSLVLSLHVKACNDAYRPRETIIRCVLMLHDMRDDCLPLQSGHGRCHCTLLLLHSAPMANKAGQGLNNALLCLIKLIKPCVALQAYRWR